MAAEDARPLLPAAVIADLERKQPWRHALIAGGHALLLAAAMAMAITAPTLPVALAASVLVGVLLFGCTILLHETTHGNVFARPRPLATRLLAFAYAAPVGIAPSQFRRWHGDHHRHLGSAGDPKRTHLSPRRRSRWLKLAYFSPLLFPLYFTAAARAGRDYPGELRRRIARERTLVAAIHLAALVLLGAVAGWRGILLGHLVPLLVVFPVVFALNRIGQHYWIDDRDPLLVGTRVDANPAWHWMFLWSNFHLEHHWYPDVPFYRLAELNRELRPFFRGRGWPSRSYTTLLRGWLIENRAPHTRW